MVLMESTVLTAPLDRPVHKVLRDRKVILAKKATRGRKENPELKARLDLLDSQKPGHSPFLEVWAEVRLSSVPTLMETTTTHVSNSSAHSLEGLMYEAK